MDVKQVKKTPVLLDILNNLDENKFHGSITIHYTHGNPRKIEYKSVHDLAEK